VIAIAIEETKTEIVREAVHDHTMTENVVADVTRVRQDVIATIRVKNRTNARPILAVRMEAVIEAS
jgi:hypothetical protein